MKVLIATKNKAKIKKYTTMLDVLNISYQTLEDFDKNIEVEETGTTPKENAIIKANAYYKAFQMPVLVDDSGLILDKLPPEKQPGVFVRRYHGKRLSDEEMIELYSKELEKVGGESTGGFIIAICIIDQAGELYIKETKHERLFIATPCKERNPGYPMNSLIYDKEKKQYLAQIYKEEDKYRGNSFETEIDFLRIALGGK